MTAESYPIPAEALLQHRGFVRALARSLTHDEHAAEDLVQETWLEALRRPPRSAEALRGWLARVTTSRARNAARAEGRRAVRERSAARTELDESEEHTRERVMLQHRVVEAVLGLQEPYRTVVLLRYDQDLEPSEIAAKRGVPPGTIRSQLSRAHGMLRQKLDHEFDGSRAAWLVPLAALATPRGATIAGGKLALAAAGILVIATTYVAIIAEPRASTEPALSSELALPRTDAEESGPPSALDTSSASTSSRRPVEQDARGTIASNPASSDLERREIPELLVFGQQVQRALRERLLTPDLQAPETAALLARVPDAQVARLLPYGRIEEDIDGRFLGIRGAGAYWSFATRSNDYDRQPDLTLSGGDFSARSYGGTAGWIYDLGGIDIADVLADPRSPPRRDDLTRDVWSLSWEDAHIAGRDFDRSVEARARTLGLPVDAPAALEHTYLLRRILPGEHDVLAVFSVLARDDYGYTIAGRVLHRWPLPEGSVEGAPPRYPVGEIPDGPDWLKALDVPALLELSHRLRAVGNAKLFAVPEELARRFPETPALDDRGFARMLHRSRYDAVTAEREGGAFFTFLTRSSAFDGSDDLRFESNRLSVSGRGAIVDLGPVPFDLVERTGSVPMDGLSARSREACEVLESVRHAIVPEDLARRQAFAGEDDQRVQALGLSHVGVPAVVGHTFLLRSVVPEKHDVLVAFAVIDTDEHGIWIRWRLLRSWPMDRDENR